jgi:predicted nicotinamide N-methyase
MRMREDTLALGRHAITIARPADAEALLDEDRFAHDEFLPYWAEVWPSGIALAEHVAALDLRGRRVLELGCGLGLPSLVAASGGADVLATDWAPEAVDLLGRNAERNAAEVRLAVVDWRTPGALLDDPFDLVLAADVLYEARNVEPLLALLPRVLPPGGQALVADPGRRHSAEFVAGLPAAGLVSEPIPSARIPRGCIFRLVRSMLVSPARRSGRPR